MFKTSTCLNGDASPAGLSGSGKFPMALGHFAKNQLGDHFKWSFIFG